MLGFWAGNFLYFNCKKHINFYVRIHFKSSRSWNFLICFFSATAIFLTSVPEFFFLACSWVLQWWSPLILVPRATRINLQPTIQDHVTKKTTGSGDKNDFLSAFVPHRLYTFLHQTTSRVLILECCKITLQLHLSTHNWYFWHTLLYEDVWMKNVRTINFTQNVHVLLSSWRFGLSTQEDAKSKWRYIYWPLPLSLRIGF